MPIKDIVRRRESMRLASQRWRQRHPEKAKEVARCGAAKWRRENPEINKEWHTARMIKSRYGLTPAEYDAKLAVQNNVCGLCMQEFDSDIWGLDPVLDHKHMPKAIPKVLRDFCHRNCNSAIGLLQDNPELCVKAAEYLRRHQ